MRHHQHKRRLIISLIQTSKDDYHKTLPDAHVRTYIYPNVSHEFFRNSSSEKLGATL